MQTKSSSKSGLPEADKAGPNRAQRRREARARVKAETDVRLTMQFCEQIRQLVASGVVVGQTVAKCAIHPGYRPTEAEAGAMLFLAQVWKKQPHLLPESLQEFLKKVADAAKAPTAADSLETKVVTAAAEEPVETAEARTVAFVESVEPLPEPTPAAGLATKRKAKKRANPSAG